jgi:hypothetical protein
VTKISRAYLQTGNGYILSRSTKKSDKSVKKWILDESGWEWNEKMNFQGQINNIATPLEISDN